MKKKNGLMLVFFTITVFAVGSLLLKPPVPKVSLGEYLVSCGFHLSPSQYEGFLTASQERQFQEQFKLHPDIKTIAAVGLHAGDSASSFFRNGKGIKKVISFDKNEHMYTSKAVAYFEEYYKSRFEFFPGDSSVTVVDYAKQFPNQKFDLIYVDGDHTFEGCLRDLMNCKNLAHPKTTLWVDDFNIPTVHSAIYTLVGQGLLEVESAHVSNSEYGERQWVKLRYRF